MTFDEVLKLALQNDPNLFMPTTVWALKEKATSQDEKSEPRVGA